MPAGEGSLAHRRHVCSRLIAQSPESLTNRLDLEKIFRRKAPLHVDLGCGDGTTATQTLTAELPGFAGEDERVVGGGVQLDDAHWAPWTADDDRYLVTHLGAQPTLQADGPRGARLA